MISASNGLMLTSSWKDYIHLCKPRIVALMLVTSLVGMVLASSDHLSWVVLILGNLGIALAAAAAATMNHLLERKLDTLMHRTQHRPLAQGTIQPKHALIFALCLCVSSMIILWSFINALTALLTFITLIGYAGIYTIYLKHLTSQNIVIGGLAGAAPPLLGWVAVTNHIQAGGLLLLLIIFIWTPPHFWALAIHRVEDYQKANIPMLPNTHGIPYTKLNILLYVILLSTISLLPFTIGMAHGLYLIIAALLDSFFLLLAICLWRTKTEEKEKKISLQTFHYSIWYLFFLFLALLIDHIVIN